MLKKCLDFIFPIVTSSFLWASDGQTFKIEEEPLFSSAKQERTFDLEKIQIEQTEQILSYLNSPPPALGIKEAKEYKLFYYDPIYQVREDITGINGEVIASKGEIINPMVGIKALQELIFFDGENPKHIEWACKLPQAKWILIKGSPLDVEEATGHETFFDQMGKISEKLGISAVPARVSKEGSRILIEEVPCID